MNWEKVKNVATVIFLSCITVGLCILAGLSGW